MFHPKANVHDQGRIEEKRARACIDDPIDLVQTGKPRSHIKAQKPASISLSIQAL